MGLLRVVLWLGSSGVVCYCMVGGYKGGKGMDQKGVLGVLYLVHLVGDECWRFKANGVSSSKIMAFTSSFLNFQQHTAHLDNS
jgi:hypothetical protein